MIVSAGADEADKWIADRAGPGDIVVTSDIPLAAKCQGVGRARRFLRHDGSELSEANIGSVLATRDLMADVRAADPFHQGRGRSFSKADRARFLDGLERAMQRAKRA